jgi:hypothetical protein
MCSSLSSYFQISFPHCNSSKDSGQNYQKSPLFVNIEPMNAIS